MDQTVTEAVTTESRFEVRRRLGSGGFGEVFEAWDRQRESTIALKTLHQQDPRAIRRFKHEFRSLAGLSHRHLVQLYELVADGDRWSFTMELVRGSDFLTAVSEQRALQPDSAEFLSGVAGVELRERARSSSRQDPQPYDEGRLRGALRQLSRGLRALHAAGKLHRDIKPQNVLVTDTGRVVILDFGMVKELAGSDAVSGRDSFVGTPQYMAPEQAVEGEAAVGEPADWYSVGVMLYQVLCGGFPIDGRSAIQILLRKQVAEKPPDEAFPEGTPDDLREVCQRLLEREPQRRPRADEILAILGGEPGSPAPRVARRDARRDGPFVGRTRELAELRGALQRTQRTGEMQVVDVTGASGIGKTELVNVFLEELADRPDVWVLRGRCYENESVPYKALDGVIDSLVDKLQVLADAKLDAMLDGDLAALARVFGVFTNLGAVRDVAAANPSSLDSPEVRKSAFETLRGLIRSVCDVATPVVVIDDVQWGDLDSADALAELLRPPAPPMLIVTTFRTDDRGRSPFLTRYEEVLAERDGVSHARVELGELSGEDASELARKLAGEDDETIARIVSEAKGSPYFIDELARFRAEGSRARTLDEAIEDRMKALDESARRFLEVIALAGRPLDVRVIREVTGARIELPHVMARLRNERLVRVRTGVGNDAVETYHDRIRETVRDRLPAERRRRAHLKLAHVLQRETPDDPEMLAMHFREGGNLEQAAVFSGRAADAALEALAFDRAAAGYREALELGTWEDDQRRQMLVKLGQAQSSLGRGNEAAEAFIRAAVLAEPIQGIELRRRAGEQLLRAGQLERGLGLLYEVLADLDVRPPRSEFGLNLSLGWLTLRNWLRGNRYEVSDEPLEEIDAIRIDTCWSAANLLGTIDVKRGALFQMLNLRQSLDSGDPVRISRTLALQSVHLSGRASTRGQAAEVLDEAMDLAQEVDDVFVAEAFVDFSRGMVEYMSGEMREAQRWFAEVGGRLAGRRSEFVWELGLIRLYELYTLYFLGEIEEYVARVPRMLEETRRRDDLLGWTAVSIWDHLRHLVADDPDTAEEVLEDATHAWTSSAWHVQHYWALQAFVRIALYRGEPESGLERIEALWGEARRGFLLHYDLTRCIAFDFRARARLATADRNPERRAEMLRLVGKDIRELDKMSMDFARGPTTLLKAQRAHLVGDEARRDELLARAEAQYSSGGAEAAVAAVRMRLGEALGPRRGGDLQKRSLDWARRKGIVDPRRFLSIIAPVRIAEFTEETE